MLEKLVSLVGDASIYVIFIPAAIGLVTFNKLDQRMRLILALVLLALIPHSARIISKVMHLEFGYFYNAYIPLELVLTAYFFRLNLSKPIYLKFVDIGLLIGLTNFLFFAMDKPFAKFYNDAVAINNIIYVGWVLLTLLEIYDDSIEFNFRQPLFWVLMGLLLYTTATPIIYPMWSVIRSPEFPKLRSLFLVNSIFNLIMYLFFAYAFYLCISQPKKIQYAR